MNSPFLDNESDIRIRTGGNLPHWHQNDKIQYVTFRLHDSLPQSKLKELKEAESNFEFAHPKPWTPEEQKLYWRTIGRLKEKWLDSGMGSGLLRHPHIRKVLSDAIWFNNARDYDVLAYVIMPNHVHILLRPYGDNEIDRIIGSIKSYSSRRINHLLSRTGPLWIRESFDRIVRSHDDLKRIFHYIARNPSHLPPSDYELYIK